MDPGGRGRTLVGDRVLGVAAVDVAAREARVRAQVLAAGGSTGTSPSVQPSHGTPTRRPPPSSRRSGGRGSAADAPARPRRRAGAGRSGIPRTHARARAPGRAPAPASRRRPPPAGFPARRESIARISSGARPVRRRGTVSGSRRTRSAVGAGPRPGAIVARRCAPSGCAGDDFVVDARPRSSASSPRRPSSRRTSTSAACTAHGSPARPRRRSSAISPRSSAADDLPARRGGHAPEREPVREREHRRGEAMAADVADLPGLLWPVGPQRAGERPAAACAARIALAVRAREVDRLPPSARRPLQVDLQHRGGIGQLMPLDPAAAGVGEEARAPSLARPPRACAGSGGPSRWPRRREPSAPARCSTSRSLWVTALRPVHGPGCSSSRNRRAFGGEAARSSPRRSPSTEQAVT